MHPIPTTRRRIAVVTSTAPGARSVDIQRAANDLLFQNNLRRCPRWSGQSTLYNGMERLGLAVNGVDNASSAATAIGNLQQALQTLFGLAVQPQSRRERRRRGARRSCAR